MIMLRSGVPACPGWILCGGKDGGVEMEEAAFSEFYPPGDPGCWLGLGEVS